MFLIQSGRDLIIKYNKDSNSNVACYSLFSFTIKIIDHFFFVNVKQFLIYRFIYKALHFHLKSIIWLICNCYGFRKQRELLSSEIHNFQCLQFVFFVSTFFKLLYSLVKTYIKMAWSQYSGNSAFLRRNPLFLCVQDSEQLCLLSKWIK